MASWIDKRALLYALLIGVCGVVGYVFRGQAIDWNWIGGAMVLTGLGVHYLFRFAEHLDRLENRIRFLEQMAGHKSPNE